MLLGIMQRIEWQTVMPQMHISTGAPYMLYSAALYSQGMRPPPPIPI
jgi:hypothetical protein